MQKHADLPDDIEALKAMVRQRDTLLAERDVLLAQRDAIIATHASEIEQLKLLIAKLRRMQFGRKSEKLDLQIEQLELRLEDLQADEGEAAVQAEKHTAQIAGAQTLAGPFATRREGLSACRSFLP